MSANAGCAICGGYLRLTIDHIIPRSRGGTDERSNLRILCVWCNSTRNSLEWSDAEVYGRRVQNYLNQYRWRALQIYLTQTKITRTQSDDARAALQALPLFGGNRGA